ncbi:hypothetical protein DPMN_157659 [Dreissena polymorpha]|uniref:Uncharacterized protein n=1 Tax=Dreissena polymorpha TaxID=45954 RepID=A0A9D4EHL5_DREPO|nr:hypothetical protein DPMN_157659 [Dreissena polymorpha]
MVFIIIITWNKLRSASRARVCRLRIGLATWMNRVSAGVQSTGSESSSVCSSCSNNTPWYGLWKNVGLNKTPYYCL